MVVVMSERATEEQIDAVTARLVDLGMDVHRSSGVTRTVLGVVGTGSVDPALIQMMDGVHEVMRISEPYKLAGRTFRPEDTVVKIDDVSIGGDEVVVMAGPCSAESKEQDSLAKEVISKKLSVREVEALVSDKSKSPKQKRTQIKKDPNTAKLEKEISETLGARVDISHNKKGSGKLVINFKNLDQLQGILNKIK